MTIHFITRLAVGWVAIWTAGATPAGPRTPVRDDEVLTTVRTTLSPADSETLRQLRRSRDASADRLPVALTLARTLIGLALAEADPRHLAQARAALAPWWAQSAAPVEVVLLRATIRQSQHDFGGALLDLDDVLRRDPQNGQAWLTRAVVLTVRGDYLAARDACLQAMRFADPLAATTATAALGGLTGKSASAHQLLARALMGADRPGEQLAADQRAVRVWALITLGELAEETGWPAEAERQYDAALQLAPRDPTALAAWADLLLGQRRPEAVLKALDGFEAIDALLLRLAEAEKLRQALEPGSHARFARRAATLRERFAAARLRGDETHLREEARFELRVEDNVPRALGLARRNWETQKERADARVLLEAAEATGDQEVIVAIRSFVTAAAGSGEVAP